MNNNRIKIGTRGSKLALWQAGQVESALSAAFPQTGFEKQVIRTRGDMILDVALSKIGDKGLFTKEIENALLNHEIDLAVHSLKDLPTELPEGLAFAGMLRRGEVRDVLISSEGKKLNELTAKDKIATSSLRRRAQLLHFNPELNIIDIRGNVDTRIKKMREGYCDALVMAGAGIIRLGYEQLITEYLDPFLVVPAAGQGAVAIEIREDDERMLNYVSAIADDDTWTMAMAERAFLRTLEGGCQVPVGCYCEKKGDRLLLTGILAAVDGSKLISRSGLCLPEEASETAIELAFAILDSGGQSILQQIRPTE